MAKWKCEICGNEFDNFHAQGFDNKIYCPLCYFKKKYLNAVSDYETTMSELQELKKENKILRENAENNDKVVDNVNWENMLLKKENKQLKQKYENAVADYETTMFEKEQLNSLVNSCQEEIRQLKKQQQEFINYLEDEIKRLKENDIYQPLQKMALATQEHTLQKYKEITRGKDEKEN